jgi:hypothetical protein
MHAWHGNWTARLTLLVRRQLLEAGANFEAMNDTGERALHIAIQRYVRNAAQCGWLSSV